MITELEIQKYLVCKSYTYCHVLAIGDGDCCYQCDCLIPNFRQLPNGYYTAKIRLDEKKEYDIIKIETYEGITGERVERALSDQGFYIDKLGDELVIAKDGQLYLGFVSNIADCPLVASEYAFNSTIQNLTSKFFTIKVTSATWNINPKGYEIILVF